MARRQSNAAVPQALHFEHRPMRDGTSADESKRRKMIRWIKKTIGIKDEDKKREPSTHHHRPNHHCTKDAPAKETGTNGLAPTFAKPRKDRQPKDRKSRAQPRQTEGGSDEGSRDRSAKVTVLLCDEDLEMLSNASAPSSCRSDASSTSKRSNQSSSSSSRRIHDARTRRRGQEVVQRRYRPDEPHVLIIGGGIGGLCLAQGLKKHGIPFTVFERDPTPNFRTQGYRTRINHDGYEALKAMLPAESFEVFLRSTGHFFPGINCVDAHTARALPLMDAMIFPDDEDVSKQVFSANRAMLRTLLLSDLYEGTEIQFDMAFQRYHVLPNGRVQVHFENGEFVQGSVLVGADGTTSRVRRQYVPRHTTLLDMDSGAIYGKTPLTPAIQQLGLAADSTTIVTSEHPKMALIIEPQCKTRVDLRKFTGSMSGGESMQDDAGDHELLDLHKYLCWVLLGRADKFHLEEDLSVQDLYTMTPSDLAEVTKYLTASWHPSLRAIIERQAPEWCSFMRISTTSPEIRSWAPSVVTLIGDAVHTMPPAGNGGNMAFQDARVLCELFVSEGVSAETIAKYELEMQHRAREGLVNSIDIGMRLYDLPPVEEMCPVVY